jgi:hypothetical protein
MPQDPYDPLTSGETPSGHTASEPGPGASGSFIGFAPVAEALTTDADAGISIEGTSDDASIVAQPTATQPVVVGPGGPGGITALCKINLREGCYRITFQPKNGTSVFHGTMRVEKTAAKTIISGDLYRFLNPQIALPATVVAVAATTIRPAPTSIFQLPLTIPVYARDKYYSYLKVTGIQLPAPFGSPCQFTLTAQEYVYTQPPPGQFNGTFPPAPGTRTVKLVLANGVPPPGYTSVYFEGKLFEGATEKGTFKMGWVSTFFRRATIEIDTLKGAVAPKAVPAISGVGQEDFKTVFKTAGWDLNVIYDQTDIPVPPGVVATDCWSNANLHALMMNNRKAGTDLDKEWRFHLIVVPAKLGCARGVMYDQIDIPREGSASFSDDGYPTGDSSNFGVAANKMQRNVPRAYLRSASHELGHGFNQIHQEQEGGADNSIMTTTPSVANVLGGPATGQAGVFPDQINLGFNEHVRQHLIHFPDPTVRPGGMTFGSGHSSVVPQASDNDRHYFSTEDLELRVVARQRQLNLGEPLQLEWELVNNSGGPIPVPNDISTEALYSVITVINPNGTLRPMPPFSILCEGASIENLAAGGRIGAESRVYWSSRGFAFERAGRHIIEVHVTWSISGVPFGVKARTDVWVNFPQSGTDNDVAATLMHPEVGMYVALGGGADHLTDAVARLTNVFPAAMGGAGAGDAADGPAPAAIRGYQGILPGSDSFDSANTASGSAASVETAGASKKGGSKKAAKKASAKKGGAKKAGKASKKGGR